MFVRQSLLYSGRICKRARRGVAAGFNTARNKEVSDNVMAMSESADFVRCKRSR